MLKKKAFLVIWLILLAVPLVSSLDICTDVNEITENCVMLTPEISCTNTSYQIFNASGTRVSQGSLTLLNESIYYFTFTEGEGEYIVRLCDGTTREVRVAQEGGRVIIAALILVPIIFGFLLLFAGVNMSEKHSVLKIFLFLLSLITFWTSLHFGMISLVKFFNFPELQDIIGTTVYWTGLTFFAIVSYFLIHFVAVAIHTAAQKKKEKIEY